MTFTRWQQVKTILAEALEYDSNRDRLNFVSASCGDDLFLKAEVEGLLAQDDLGWCDEAFLVRVRTALLSAVERVSRGVLE